MKSLLGSLLFLATLVTACNAVCSLEFRKGLPNQLPGECVDPDGGKHPINSFWVRDCKKCFCREDAISCCSIVVTPVSYDKEKCQQTFHPENCTYSVVEKKNPGKFCLVEGWVL
ncbi:beta-microseminoprotein [Mesocricetus auratus]|uniref:Beta-microseminoprotein n=1 Tax=Mesocricetus auratus TaxID=10036 RepID=A0A1U8CEI8_MESAU|nr:beta-microseminoprotein [Mesocricetus auratus]